MKYEIEVMREIWPDKGVGERWEIGPDRDGLECVEIRQRDPDGKISARISFSPELALLVADSIKQCSLELKPHEPI